MGIPVILPRKEAGKDAASKEFKQRWLEANEEPTSTPGVAVRHYLKSLRTRGAASLLRVVATLSLAAAYSWCDTAHQNTGASPRLGFFSFYNW